MSSSQSNTRLESEPIESELTLLIKQQQEEIIRLKIEIDALKAKTLDIEGEIPYKTIIALMPGNLYWKNLNGRYLGANDNAARLAGFKSRDEIIGKYDSDLFEPEIVRQLAKMDEEIIKAGEMRYIEETGFNEKNEPAIFLSQKIPLRNNLGEVVGILGISFDITNRKKMEEELRIAKEQAEAAYQTKTQFLAIVNHELRTPITSILGILSLMKKEGMQNFSQYLEIIENCSQHLLGLINDLLDVSRVEMSQSKLHFEYVNINHLLNDVYKIASPLAQNKNLQFHILSDDNIPKAIFTHVLILRQIIINLANNAIKFTENGEVIIHVKCLAKKSNKSELQISIIDTGIGIPEDKFDLIFEPFQQLEDAYTRQSSRRGTGLGLTIVKKFATSIGIQVGVASQIGKGSTFSLCGEFETEDDETLSIAIPIKDQSCDENSSHLMHLPVAHKPRVLLVEDDSIIQFIHRKMLMDIGCHVDISASGQDALNKLDSHQIIFIDINLADMNGFEVIKAIRKRDDAYKMTIIVLTAHITEEEKIESFNVGADTFVVKPVSYEHLKELILRYIR